MDRELEDLQERARKVQLGPRHKSPRERQAAKYEAAARRIADFDADSDAWSRFSDEERREYSATHRHHGLSPSAWRVVQLADATADPQARPWELAVAQHERRERDLAAAEQWREREVASWNSAYHLHGVPPDGDPLTAPEQHEKRQDFIRRMAWVQRLQKADGDALLAMHHSARTGEPDPGQQQRDEPAPPVPRPELR
jgi:hypothetical protein